MESLVSFLNKILLIKSEESMRNAAIDKHQKAAPDAEETHASAASGAEEGEEEEHKEEDAAVEVGNVQNMGSCIKIQ